MVSAVFLSDHATPRRPVIQTDGQADGDRSELLRRFEGVEPVVRYNQGELFFPTASRAISPSATCWSGTSERDARGSAGGEVTTAVLGSAGRAARASRSTCAWSRRMPNGVELARWRTWRIDRLPCSRPAGVASGLGRLVDAGFEPRCCWWHGRGGRRRAAPGEVRGGARGGPALRVLRAGGADGRLDRPSTSTSTSERYRSTFHGANDHEADWEQVFVYLDSGRRPRRLDRGGRARLRRRRASAADGMTRRCEGRRSPRSSRGRFVRLYFEQGEYVTRSHCRASRGRGLPRKALAPSGSRTLRQPDRAPGGTAARPRTRRRSSTMRDGKAAIGLGRRRRVDARPDRRRIPG